MDEVTRISREMSRKHYSKPEYQRTAVDTVAMVMLGIPLALMVLLLIYTAVALPLP